MRGTYVKALAAAAAALGCLLAPASAMAEVRTATKPDGPDPTVTYDLEQVRVSFDRDAGRIELTVRFGHELPATQSTGNADSASVRLTSRCPTSSSTSSVAGDTTVGLKYEDPSGSPPAGYYTTYRVEFRESSTKQPAVLSADRREWSVTIDDPLLLKGADLKCLSASGYGRAYYDPTQPNGGTTSDSLDGDPYLDGFGAPVLLAPAHESSTRGTAPPLEWITGNAPDRAVVTVPEGEVLTDEFTLDASSPGERTAKERFGSEELRYRVEIANGVTRVTLLDHIFYRAEYKWYAERGDGYSAKSEERKFSIGPPEVTALSARAKHKRGTKRTSLGSSTWTVASAPLARFELQVTRGGKVVKSSKGKLDEDGDAPTLRYRWSCSRAGVHKWRILATDEYGNQRVKRGSFTVGSRPCRSAPKKKGSKRPASKCDPSYPTVCIKPPPPDLDCPDIPYRDFTVRGADPHGFDGNDDGVGCET